MLVVTANWAFTDGTLGIPSVKPPAAREWLRSIGRVAAREGCGRDGRYRPVRGVDIVLAGDTFDELVSTAWSGRDRPWHAGPRAAEARQRVTLGCARRAAPLLAGLARLARRGLPVPAADPRGRPVVADRVRVPVRVVLLPGDRDRHLAEVATAVGDRGATVAPAWSDEAVLVAHGHEFDPACHVRESPAGEDRPPALAESVAADLVVPFAAMLAGDGIPRAVGAPIVAALAGADPAGIPSAVAAWSGPGGPGAALDAATRRDVAAAWCRAVDAWLRAARRTSPDCGLAASPVDPLAAWFAAAPGRIPDVLHDCFAQRLPPAGGAFAGGRCLVLGHPAAPGVGRSICLGRPPLRRWGPVAVVRGNGAADVACVAPAPPTAPATVVCRRDGERSEWHWLGGERPSRADAAVHPAVVDAA